MSVLTLVLNIPYFITAKIVPPLHIVNQVLRTGKLDAGMGGGCVWPAFELSEEEHAEIATMLKRHGFRSVKVPGWVTTLQDWSRWKAELVWGTPALESKKYLDDINHLLQGQTEAEAAGARARVLELVDAINQKCSEWVKFLDSHRAAKPRIPLLRKRPPAWVEPHRVVRRHPKHI